MQKFYIMYRVQEETMMAEQKKKQTREQKIKTLLIGETQKNCFGF